MFNYENKPKGDLTIPERLKYYRTLRGFTRKALARRAGIPLATYEKYEYAQVKEPNARHLARVAKALNVTVDDLIGDDF